MSPDQPLDTDQWAALEAKRSQRRRSFWYALGLTPLAAAAAVVAGGLVDPAAGLALAVAALLVLGAWRNDTALSAALGCALSLILCSLPAMYTSDDGLGVLAIFAVAMAAPFVIGLVLLGARIQRWELARGARQGSP